MSNASDIPEATRLLAEQAGLAKALKLFPDGVKAAAERGLKPVGDPPKGHVPTASPAPVFNPAAFEQQKMTDLAWLTVAEGAALLRAKKLSPVEWTRALLDRIAAIDGHYNAFITVTADKALAQAKAAEAEIAKGQWRGPMHGVPYAAKDIFDIEGMATTCHSKIRQRPSRDVRRVRHPQAQRCGRGAARQGRAARVRDRRSGVRPALAARPQSLGPQPPSRRLVERLGRGARRGHGAGRARHRHRRLGAQSRDLLRHHRAEADLRRGQPQRRVPADPFARSRRSDDAHGRGQCGVLSCHRGPRSGRRDQHGTRAPATA